jgi:hypothetical protein
MAYWFFVLVLVLLSMILVVATIEGIEEERRERAHWRSLGICPRCKGKKYGEQYISHHTWEKGPTRVVGCHSTGATVDNMYKIPHYKVDKCWECRGTGAYPA